MKELSAGLLLLSSQRQPQKYPLPKAQELWSRETFFFLVTQQKPFELQNLIGKSPSFQVRTPHFLPDPSFILSVASKAQNYEH